MTVDERFDVSFFRSPTDVAVATKGLMFCRILIPLQFSRCYLRYNKLCLRKYLYEYAYCQNRILYHLAKMSLRYKSVNESTINTNRQTDKKLSTRKGGKGKGMLYHVLHEECRRSAHLQAVSP